MDNAVAKRTLVDGVVDIISDGVELCCKGALAHHLTSVVGSVVAHFCLRIDHDAGAV